MSRKKREKPEWQPRPYYAWDSPEAKAIKVLHQIVARNGAFFAIWRRREDGAVSFSRDITAQLLALHKAGDVSTWVSLNYRQAAAWEEFLRAMFDKGVMRAHLRDGSRAPWPWPPSPVDGRLYPDANGIPPPNNEDLEALSSEGQG